MQEEGEQEPGPTAAWSSSAPLPTSQHLLERSWYAVTETCLAFTVFRDDFSPRFVALFTLLLFLKCFHWLAEDRVDFVSGAGTFWRGGVWSGGARAFPDASLVPTTDGKKPQHLLSLSLPHPV